MDKYIISASLQKLILYLQWIITSDCKFSGAFGPPHAIFCNNLILPCVFGSNPQYKQGADATGVGDIVVDVGIENNIVS